MTSSVSTAGLRIGFVGLGTMGQAMALNLHAHRIANGDPPLAVYNRTAAKVQPLEAQGAVVYESASAVAANSDVVFISLFNGDAVKQVVGEILDSLADAPKSNTPLVIADTTTVHPSVPTWIVEQVSLRQESLGRPVQFSQTPVWGAPPAAVAAKLVLVTSGSASELIEAIAVPAFARVALNCGADVARAAKFKILGNFMIAAIIEAMGEAFAVADESGIGRELYLEFIKQMFPVPSFVAYGSRMVDQAGEASKTQVSFTVPGGMKDVGYAIDVAKDVGMRLPIAELAYEHLQWVKDNGDPNWDWSSLAFALRKSAQQ
ncbi:hypothetical protein LPJ73_005086 [Coemansia sp. RSA 2703]|nr:hypothetical protein LPJ73_005086 [Coemansia sp. RSA 2703]KAJ2394780.1 hypothetical protein GGI05_001880 [Coemansia sp. RSA 2603]